MTVLAKAKVGSEYLYVINSAHKVPKASARKIMDILNDVRWNLKDGEIWHMYEIDEYCPGYTYAATQRFSIRKGIVKRSCY